MKKLIYALFGLAIMGGSVCASAQSNSSEIMKVGALLAPADETIDIWVDHAAEEFAGGDGTEASPYKIQNAAQLAKIARDLFFGKGEIDYAGQYFVIENDIDMDGHSWFPIGFSAEAEDLGKVYFGGKVNGRGHKILNMKTQSLNGFTNYGLFGSTSGEFELKNLIIESGDLEGLMSLGAFVGYNQGLVENCINKVDVNCLMYYAGGIVGTNSSVAGNGTVRNCQNFGNVIAGFTDTPGLSAAGIAGSSSGMIENCINYGKISANTTEAGGIVGILEGGVVSQCINRGSLNAPEQVGGIVAAALGRSSSCEVKNCYSASEISCDSIRSRGGIIGVALFQNMNTLKIVNNYFDSSLFGGSGPGHISDLFGQFTVQNNVGKTTDEMKSADFVSLLDSESEGKSVWRADEKNINDGYPVLEFMLTPLVGVEEQAEDNVAVAVQNGYIVLNGVDEKAAVAVYGINGMMMFDGVAAELGYVAFEKGIYVLQVAGKTYKVCVR